MELKKLKSVMIDYESSKKILNEYKNENKHLIEHKFNDKCKECNQNKKIYEKINYVERINELTNFILSNTNINDNIIKLEIELESKQKINMLKEKIIN
jgi:hypothetical protein